MPHEIERKYLVDPNKITNHEKQHPHQLRQGYLSFGPVVRVRHSTETNGKTKGFITIKGPGKIKRSEFEYEIPAEEAMELLMLAKAVISKIRYHAQFAGKTWEIDEFVGAHKGLWLAEIELQSEKDQFETPPWVIREVTNDGRYTNAALAQNQGIP